MKYICGLALSVLLSTTVSHADEHPFEIKQVANGVYAAIAQPSFRTNANAAIILLGDSVVVVDAESKPSAARAVITEIKRLTNMPVSHLVITHFHGDHVQGAAEYRREWPNVQIISTEETRKSIEARLVPRMKRELLGLPGRIEKLKSDLEKTSESSKKVEMQRNIQQGESYLSELTAMTALMLPNISIQHSMALYGKSRNIEILWLGKAHTDGDLFIYVPDAKVIVTGDAVHGATPSMADSYPYDWIQTLDLAQRRDIDYIIGGHGDVLRGKEPFELWKRYFTELLELSAQSCTAGDTTDEARKRISQTLLANYDGKFPTGGAGAFPKTVFDNIEKAYQIVCGPLVNNPIAH
jgi:cyclase